MHARQDLSAEGASKGDTEVVEGGGKWVGVIPLPSRLRGLRQRRKLPS